MRRAAVALVVAGILAGCVESDPSTVQVAPAGPTTTVAGAPGSPAGPAGGGPDGGSTTGSVVPGAPDGGAPPTTAGPGSSAPVDRGPGSLAAWFLRPSGASRLVVQVLSQRGAEPTGATVDRLTAVLAEVAGKQVTTAGGAAPPDREVWGSADLRQAADAAAFTTSEGTAVVRVLFLHGRSDQGEDVLGIASGGDVAAVFSDRVDDAATALVSAATIERAVATHELGHLLGLVDLVLDTGRADPEHPGHSGNRRSVMYWAVESSLVTDLLSGGPPQQFDDADRADLETIRRG